jgi:hypothetical protein
MATSREAACILSASGGALKQRFVSQPSIA